MSTTTVPIQIRVDRETREEANELFRSLGTDMSGAINMFLKQCVLTSSIPLKLRKPHFRQEVLDAMEEARHLSRDPNSKKYHTFDDYQSTMQQLLEEDESEDE